MALHIPMPGEVDPNLDDIPMPSLQNTKIPAVQLLGVENARKRLKAFSIQKKQVVLSSTAESSPIRKPSQEILIGNKHHGSLKKIATTQSNPNTDNSDKGKQPVNVKKITKKVNAYEHRCNVLKLLKPSAPQKLVNDDSLLYQFDSVNQKGFIALNRRPIKTLYRVNNSDIVVPRQRHISQSSFTNNESFNEIDLEDLVVCDSWSLENEPNAGDGGTNQGTKERKRKEKHIEGKSNTDKSKVASPEIYSPALSNTSSLEDAINFAAGIEEPSGKDNLTSYDSDENVKDILHLENYYSPTMESDIEDNATVIQYFKMYNSDNEDNDKNKKQSNKSNNVKKDMSKSQNALISSNSGKNIVNKSNNQKKIPVANTNVNIQTGPSKIETSIIPNADKKPLFKIHNIISGFQKQPMEVKTDELGFVVRDISTMVFNNPEPHHKSPSVHSDKSRSHRRSSRSSSDRRRSHSRNKRSRRQDSRSRSRRDYYRNDSYRERISRTDKKEDKSRKDKKDAEKNSSRHREKDQTKSSSEKVKMEEKKDKVTLEKDTVKSEEPPLKNTLKPVEDIIVKDECKVKSCSDWESSQSPDVRGKGSEVKDLKWEKSPSPLEGVKINKWQEVIVSNEFVESQQEPQSVTVEAEANVTEEDKRHERVPDEQEDNTNTAWTTSSKDPEDSWKDVLDACGPYVHTNPRCLRKTKFSPVISYSSNVRMCGCVEGLPMKYEKLSSRVADITSQMPTGHCQDSTTASTRDWYPNIDYVLTDKSGIELSTNWETDDSTSQLDSNMNRKLPQTPAYNSEHSNAFNPEPVVNISNTFSDNSVNQSRTKNFSSERSVDRSDNSIAYSERSGDHSNKSTIFSERSLDRVKNFNTYSLNRSVNPPDSSSSLFDRSNFNVSKSGHLSEHSDERLKSFSKLSVADASNDFKNIFSDNSTAFSDRSGGRSSQKSGKNVSVVDIDKTKVSSGNADIVTDKKDDSVNVAPSLDLEYEKFMEAVWPEIASDLDPTSQNVIDLKTGKGNSQESKTKKDHKERKKQESYVEKQEVPDQKDDKNVVEASSVAEEEEKLRDEMLDIPLDLANVKKKSKKDTKAEKREERKKVASREREKKEAKNRSEKQTEAGDWSDETVVEGKKINKKKIRKSRSVVKIEKHKKQKEKDSSKGHNRSSRKKDRTSSKKQRRRSSSDSSSSSSSTSSSSSSSSSTSTSSSSSETDTADKKAKKKLSGKKKTSKKVSTPKKKHHKKHLSKIKDLVKKHKTKKKIKNKESTKGKSKDKESDKTVVLEKKKKDYSYSSDEQEFKAAILAEKQKKTKKIDPKQIKKKLKEVSKHRAKKEKDKKKKRKKKRSRSSSSSSSDSDSRSKHKKIKTKKEKKRKMEEAVEELDHLPKKQRKIQVKQNDDFEDNEPEFDANTVLNIKREKTSDDEDNRYRVNDQVFSPRLHRNLVQHEIISVNELHNDFVQSSKTTVNADIVIKAEPLQEDVEYKTATSNLTPKIKSVDIPAKESSVLPKSATVPKIVPVPQPSFEKPIVDILPQVPMQVNEPSPKCDDTINSTQDSSQPLEESDSSDSDSTSDDSDSSNSSVSSKEASVSPIPLTEDVFKLVGAETSNDGPTMKDRGDIDITYNSQMLDDVTPESDHSFDKTIVSTVKDECFTDKVTTNDIKVLSTNDVKVLSTNDVKVLSTNDVKVLSKPFTDMFECSEESLSQTSQQSSHSSRSTESRAFETVQSSGKIVDDSSSDSVGKKKQPVLDKEAMAKKTEAEIESQRRAVEEFDRLKREFEEFKKQRLRNNASAERIAAAEELKRQFDMVENYNIPIEVPAKKSITVVEKKVLEDIQPIPTVTGVVPAAEGREEEGEVRGEIKWDWRPDNTTSTIENRTRRSSRWGMVPSTTLLQNNSTLIEVKLKSEEEIHLPSARDPVAASIVSSHQEYTEYESDVDSAKVYRIQTISSTVESRDDEEYGGDPADYDANYESYGDAMQEMVYVAGMGTEAKSDDEETKAKKISLDERINLVLKYPELSVAPATAAVVPASPPQLPPSVALKASPDKGILIVAGVKITRVDPRTSRSKKVCFADGLAPGQDSDLEDELKPKQTKKSKQSAKKKVKKKVCGGHAYPCPPHWPDYNPQWDCLPPPPPPPGSPPPHLYQPHCGVVANTVMNAPDAIITRLPRIPSHTETIMS